MGHDQLLPEGSILVPALSDFTIKDVVKGATVKGIRIPRDSDSSITITVSKSRPVNVVSITLSGK